jgi:hypothetical protein
LVKVTAPPSTLDTESERIIVPPAEVVRVIEPAPPVVERMSPPAQLPVVIFPAAMILITPLLVVMGPDASPN